MANDTSFFAELKRRNVYRVGIAYAIASWMLLQVIDVVEPIIGVPAWVPKLILVVLAVGLPLALFFAWAYEMTPEGLKREIDVDRTQSITHETGQRLNRMIIGVLVVAVGLLLLDRYATHAPEQQAVETVAATEASSEVVESTAPSIAVLPFANMSADESSTYFSDGLADTLLHMLAQIREIRVAARTSSFQFRDQNTDITKIAEALNVGTILEGSVQKSGNKIRVTAQLIEAETGFHLWSGNFDRDLDDVFAIQDEIANEVVAALKISLLGETAEKLTQHDTDNVGAYTEYLLGINEVNEFSFGSLPRAEQRLRSAVDLDPGYAMAWAQLGYTYLQMLDTGMGTRTELLEKARAAASHALDLDENSPVAMAVLGAAEEWDGNDDVAEQLYRRAMAAGPNDSISRLYYANLLLRQNRHEDALQLMEQALTFNPLSTDVLNLLSVFYRISRDYDRALETNSRIRDISPQSPVSYYREAEVLFRMGDWAQAAITATDAHDVDPRDPELAVMIGDYYLAMELPGDAQKWYDRAAEIDADHPVARATRLTLDLYQDAVTADTVQLARRLVDDKIDDRQGARGFALHVIWRDALRNDRLDETLDYLSGHFPEYFADDGSWSERSIVTDWYMGAMLMSAGRDELAMRVLQPMLDDSREFSEKYGTSSLHVWNLAAAQKKDELLVALRQVLEAEHAPDNWPTAIGPLPAFDFVRDEPEYREYLAFLENRAAEQREELARLLGTEQKKRGPT